MSCNRRRFALGIPPAVFLLTMYVVPLAAVFRRVTDGGGLGSGQGIWHGVGRLVAVSLLQAVASTLLTVSVGVPAAWCHARLEFPGRRLLWSGILVPFVLPTVVFAAGVIAVAGRPGAPLGDQRGSWLLVLVAHAAVNLAVVVRTVGVAIARVGSEVEGAARSMGRSRLGAAMTSVAAVRSSVIGAAVVVFVFSLTSFGLIVLLGSASVRTVEVDIWVRTTQLLDLRGAGTLALGQLVVVVGVLWLHQRSIADRLAAGPSAVPRRRRPVGRERLVVVVAAGVEAVAIGVPLGGLSLRALSVDGGVGLDNFTALLRRSPDAALAVSPIRAVVNSLAVGATAAGIAMFVGICGAVIAAGRSRSARWADGAMMLPLGTSAATVGFGVLIASSYLPIDLRGSWWAIPLVESAVATPLVVRGLVPAIVDLDRQVLDAASVLGASGRDRLLRVVVPLLRPSLVSAAVLAFAVSLGEFGATAFLSREDAPTLPVVIVRLLGRPGSANLGQAMALGVILAVMAGLAVALVDRFGAGRSGAGRTAEF